MLFTEFRFIIFFLIVFVVSWKLKQNNWRKLWLLLCSYVFYAAWDWKFLFLLLALTGVAYLTSLRIDESSSPVQRKGLLFFTIIFSLTVLGVFKYYNFFIDSAFSLLGFLGIPAGLPTLQIILPAGISFYTFHILSYSVDVYLGKLRPSQNFADLALYITFFPHLVAGPIVRASEFLPQLDKIRSFAEVNVRGNMVLFLIGFIKKACISDNLSPIVEQYFAAPETYNAASSWVGVLFYATQIYCDFSGYSDMAIASAGLLGYKFPVNFDFPYFSPNVTVFWRRWHISLSNWLRDYLYIPLGGNRGGKLATYKNLMITMVLGGLWHGASWNFIIWGTLHGIALIVQREWARLAKPYAALQPFRELLGPVITFYFICVTWVFFRSTNFMDSIEILKSFVLFQSPGSETLDVRLLGVIVLLSIAHWLTYRRLLTNWWNRLPGWLFSTGYGVAAAILMAFVPTGYTPFIYFQF